jgi:hypothetical protein
VASVPGAYDGTATVDSGVWLLQVAAFIPADSDTVPPTVILTAPDAGAVVSNTVFLSATATDDVGVAGVQFQVDGANVGAEVLSPPYTNSWNTLSVANGSHKVQAIARDVAGNRAINGVSVTVSNASVPGPLQPVFIQENYATPQSPQTQVGVAFLNPQTAGDANVLAIGWCDTVADISAVTDSAGNIYQVAVPTCRGSGLSQAIYYAVGITAGSNTVTVTFDQPASYVDLRVTEYSRLNPTNAFDVGGSGTGSGPSADSGSVTTSVTNELLFCAGMAGSMYTAPGAGFTQRVITSPDGDLVEDTVASVPGAYDGTATVDSGVWLLQVAAFIPADSQSLVPPAFTTFGFSSGGFVLNFSTVSGQNYELQSRSDLTVGSWSSVITNILGTGGIVQVEDTNAVIQFQRFYRLSTGK